MNSALRWQLGALLCAALVGTANGAAGREYHLIDPRPILDTYQKGAAPDDAMRTVPPPAAAPAPPAPVTAEAPPPARRGSSWSLFWLVLLGAAAAYGFWKRTWIMRWYYLLTPHPAAGVINQAIRTNAPIDGATLAALARQPAHNAVERDVRAEQAHALTERARAHLATLASETRREEAYIHSQTDLAEAALDFEIAKARLEAVQKRTRAS